ncbi:hypothetical protein Hanom_Chr13g01235381 [Helianthus anomalus]
MNTYNLHTHETEFFFTQVNPNPTSFLYGSTRTRPVFLKRVMLVDPNLFFSCGKNRNKD